MPVGVAINFDDQICFMGVKIRNESTDDMLPSEFEAVELVAQTFPKFLLGGMRILAHLADESQKILGLWLTKTGPHPNPLPEYRARGKDRDKTVSPHLLLTVSNFFLYSSLSITTTLPCIV